MAGGSALSQHTHLRTQSFEVESVQQKVCPEFEPLSLFSFPNCEIESLAVDRHSANRWEHREVVGGG